MGAKPKRVRPTTAAQNIKLFQKATENKSQSRDTLFTPKQEDHQSPRCSRERCRDLIK
jgi:hypothetical protein